MLSTLLILVAVWAVTVPAVLGLGRLLGRVSAPRVAAAPAPEPEAEPSDNVVPLVSRPQNELQRRAA
ncbi:MAG TPA: hypothetical protein VF549_01490 [Solirubrobacteraceae bacterium]|jgi:hypothetical protein